MILVTVCGKTAWILEINLAACGICEYVDATCLTISMSTPNSFNSSIVKFWNRVSANAKNEFFCLDGVLLYLSYVEFQTSWTTSFFKSWNIPESANARLIILNSVLNGFMSPHPCNTSGQVSCGNLITLSLIGK